MSSRRWHASFSALLFLAITYHHQRGFISSVITTAKTNEIAPSAPATSLIGARKEDELRHGNATRSDHVTEPKEVSTKTKKPMKKTSKTPLGIATNRSRQDEFLPENIGWPSDVPCGSFKCFYQLKSNRNVGYLIIPQFESKRIRTLQAGWLLANQLKEEYGIRHFLTEPPRELKVSKKLGPRLKKKFRIGDVISIQKVKVAPRKHLLIGCVESKYTAVIKRLPKFLSQVKDPETFAMTFRDNLNVARQIVEEDQYKCLIKDFQLMVDTSGKIYHLDFDRCYMSTGKIFEMSKSFTTSCFLNLDKIERYILDGAGSLPQ